MAEKTYNYDDLTRLVQKISKEKPLSRKEIYQKELSEYLTSKLSKYNVPIHEILEIVQYAAVGTQLVLNAEVEQVHREWKHQISKGGTLYAKK